MGIGEDGDLWEVGRMVSCGRQGGWWAVGGGVCEPAFPTLLRLGSHLACCEGSQAFTEGSWGWGGGVWEGPPGLSNYPRRPVAGRPGLVQQNQSTLPSFFRQQPPSQSLPAPLGSLLA